MEEQKPDEQRDETPSRTMDVTPLTSLEDGVYWTLDESAEHVVLYDAITGRQLTNVVTAYQTYHQFPAVHEDETSSLMSVVVRFSADVNDPNAKQFTFAGTVLHLEYIPEDENEERSGGGSGSGDDDAEEGEEQGTQEGDATEAEEGEGDDSGEGEGQGNGSEGGEGEDGEGQGEGGEGDGTPTSVTEGDYQPKGEHGGGGGIGGHKTEGKVAIGRNRIAWEVKS